MIRIAQFTTYQLFMLIRFDLESPKFRFLTKCVANYCMWHNFMQFGAKFFLIDSNIRSNEKIKKACVVHERKPSSDELTLIRFSNSLLSN
ncbi:MAG: hypothetical protein CFH06_02085 [Alphaproteobacteria bacterium MarineAlpha3_Bin5]|nr:hypothetical protein [Magnetovibrio sp.]PPR74660.1 MAG: hypothetical protein CFH06_02085 [Alphaproteobacteria bacterium MarineAlpha3_Bin5]